MLGTKRNKNINTRKIDNNCVNTISSIVGSLALNKSHDNKDLNNDCKRIEIKDIQLREDNNPFKNSITTENNIVQGFSLEFSNSHSHQNKTCCLCFRKLSPNRKDNYFLVCGHPYHLACIRKKLKLNDTQIKRNGVNGNNNSNLNDSNDSTTVTNVNSFILGNIENRPNNSEANQEDVRINSEQEEMNEINQNINQFTNYSFLFNDNNLSERIGNTNNTKSSDINKELECFVCKNKDTYFYNSIQNLSPQISKIKILFEEINKYTDTLIVFDEFVRYYKIFLLYFGIYLYFRFALFLTRESMEIMVELLLLIL